MTSFATSRHSCCVLICVHLPQPPAGADHHMLVASGKPYIVMPMCPSKFILLFKINIINTRLNTSNIECFRQRCNSCSNLVNSVDTSNLLLNPSYTVHIKFFRFGFGTFNEVPPNSNMTLNIILFQNGNRIYIQCLHS